MGHKGGVILGKRQYLDKIRRHPLLQVLRIDKMATLALQVTLLHYLRKEAIEKVPVWQMINYPMEEIASRAKEISKRLTELGVVSSTYDGFSTVGGGSLPDQTLPTKLITIEPPYAVEDFAKRLRLSSHPFSGGLKITVLLSTHALSCHLWMERSSK